MIVSAKYRVSSAVMRVARARKNLESLSPLGRLFGREIDRAEDELEECLEDYRRLVRRVSLKRFTRMAYMIGVVVLIGKLA